MSDYFFWVSLTIGNFLLKKITKRLPISNFLYRTQRGRHSQIIPILISHQPKASFASLGHILWSHNHTPPSTSLQKIK